MALISAVAQFAVSINYSMVDYLPEDSPSTTAMDVMEEEFDGSVANTRVMINDITIQEALTFKKDLEAIEGVSDVTWLDDAIDTKTPIEMADPDTTESYYKDGNALFSFHIEDGKEVETTDAIYSLIGKNGAMSGEALDTALSQKMTGKESMYAAALLIPIIIIILILSTRSWAEPVFFLTAIGISVLINLGTNIFIGEISFITQSVAPILQLAVSLDYAIFLLHSFAEYRKKTEKPAEAMKMAMKRSFPAIAASASTTFFGFIALTFMNFEIGADLGLNLVKGIALSFISVMIFLPALTLLFYPWIDKTEHKQLLPSIRNVGKTLMKFRIPALLLLFILIVPAFLGQSQTNFMYGIGEQPESSRAYKDDVAIEDVFGKHTPMVLLLPKGDIAKEENLVQEIKGFSEVKSTVSYVDAISPAIPPEYLGKSITEQFFSNNYSRIIINTTADTEGKATFALIEEIKALASDYYSDTYHLLGESVTLYDMKQVVEKDNTVVNLLTVIAIAIVLLITFRSLSFPIVLLVTIQSAVWINLSIPYFSDTSLIYVGYLIISTVQLAATVDYAILLTESYKENRKKMRALSAIKRTIDEKIFSIGVSASILSSVGFILWLTSSNEIVASIGLLLGRGALLAFIMVVLVLPALLTVFDRAIEKTTWKANFYKGK